MWLNSGRTIQNLKGWWHQGVAFNMSANLEDPAVATGLEKVNPHPNPQEEEICHYFHLFPLFCHEVMGLDAMILVFLVFSFKQALSLSSFTLIKRLFSSSSLSAIRMVSSTYLWSLMFLLKRQSLSQFPRRVVLKNVLTIGQLHSSPGQ